MAKLDLKLYRGYMNEERLIVFGHAFKSWAPDKYKIDKKGIRNAFSIIHKFRIKPLKNQEVVLNFRNIETKTTTASDGFFQFEIAYEDFIESGWHEYSVSCQIDNYGIIEKGEVLKPFKSKYGIISDIDDTFLISHSDSFFKKLYIMLFKNVNKRKVFADVTPHYQALSRFGQANENAFNSFFYVSSSEWNLYDFIIEFTRLHELPKAVLLLKQIKTGVLDFFKTGRGNHNHKLDKINNIIDFYPDLEYVLLGDDTQHDVFIYQNISKQLPQNVKAVYIRQTGKTKDKKVEEALEVIEKQNISTCYFRDSKKAIAHSQEIGVI
ncbi:hypothetical protein CW751_04775 [Brumimicrobium salinarum]|uniref:Phosphatidate phosphatase APP1 catalytic domain-containing protein n=1 Tax=Brumimicrobium salinarum TaxID=2058658 RepID=A0A2I0R465_9FLAO|nr:App1 family protein [Brumimicrobium salinarum]PKR81373.1 hypothetical protein CW751_04775 [Brumimicrobium salinarum]